MLVSVSVFIVDLIILSYLYATYFAKSSIEVLCLVATLLGFSMGFVAGLWGWTKSSPRAFLAGTFSAGFAMLLPFLIVTYGYAIIALPFVILWTVANMAGMRISLTMK